MPEEYDSTTAYNEGDFVIYGDNVYEAKTDIVIAESFNDSHWKRMDHGYDAIVIAEQTVNQNP